MNVGLIKWFDKEKGFGMIGTFKRKECFLHVNNFEDVLDKLLIGTAVIFNERFDKKKNRSSASKCRIINTIDDWYILFDNINLFDVVEYEVKYKNTSRWKTYYTKEKRSRNILKSGAYQLFSKQIEIGDKVTDLWLDYYEGRLKENHYYKFISIIDYALDCLKDKDLRDGIKTRLFLQFGRNKTNKLILNCWQNNNMQFIGLDNDDELNEAFFSKVSDDLSLEDLKKIYELSFGPEFCKEYSINKINSLSHDNDFDLKALFFEKNYNYLEFIGDEKKGEYRTKIDDIYFDLKRDLILSNAEELNEINDLSGYNKYRDLFYLIPDEINNIKKTELENIVKNIMLKKCSKSFLPELWFKGMVEDITFNEIEELFFKKENSSANRIKILKRLDEEEVENLFSSYIQNNDIENSFTFLKNLIKGSNSFPYEFNYENSFHESEFWLDKKFGFLIPILKKYIFETTSENEKYELFFKNIVKDIPQQIVLKRIKELEISDLYKILDSLNDQDQEFIHKVISIKHSEMDLYDLDRILKHTCEEEFILDLIIKKIGLLNDDKYEYLYDIAIKYLGDSRFKKFDKQVKIEINPETYFKLWEAGRGKIYPLNYLKGILADDKIIYDQIEIWIKDEIISQEEINKFIESLLVVQKPITDRTIFYTYYNQISYLLGVDHNHVNIIRDFKNEFYNIIIWFLGFEEKLNFELLKSKFVYFSPHDQVIIIKRLFYLKRKNEFDLTLDKLDDLTKIDLDLYKLNFKFNPSIPLDISTDVVIQSLKSFRDKKSFILEGEVLKIVLEDISNAKKTKFKLDNYFENCFGRTQVKYDWKTNGKISKQKYDNNRFYFKIQFEYSESLVEKIRKLPGRKWNGDESHWGVPSKYEKEVLEFAKENKFFLDLEGSNYINNPHLADFELGSIPNGIKFCEGRLANKKDNLFNKEFWWCKGDKCYDNCKSINPITENELTLLNFCEILGFNTDEVNGMGDLIPNGFYYRFLGQINRFNRLLDKMYCSDCDEILHPVETSHFAAHTVVRFCCMNEMCTKHEEQVYLNHCLNGKCNNVIDSRISKKCKNGLYICDNCGSCCSHNMFQRRLSSLKSTGGYIHPSLAKIIDNKLGHLERAEYFCHKCSLVMKEIQHDVFHCSDCDITYNTIKYRLKRPHRDLRRQGSSNIEEIGDDFDLPY
ncbi:cold shock domain-containing protein [Psychroserpens algicola]|uniref:cold shock domain-containing protein n=1 Tax=Psychroserpens algicola TaxID=1719034 RepID=UPI001953D218|nr:cold shock domain-containing protein [Psychroserpens algicola]